MLSIALENWPSLCAAADTEKPNRVFASWLGFFLECTAAHIPRTSIPIKSSLHDKVEMVEAFNGCHLDTESSSGCHQCLNGKMRRRQKSTAHSNERTAP